jgi:hypothetical protein
MRQLSKLDKWNLRRIAKKAVAQGSFIEDNMVEYFLIIIEAAHREYTEDLPSRLDWILEDLFQFALDEREKTDKYEYD